jgi:16S rRNA U516 pseudouridylate synthase RsuA-like enzyme
MSKILLQKFIADSGYCSRRKAEELVRAARVRVNGNPAKLGMRVDKNDDVRVSSKKIGSRAQKTYLIFNKPVRYTCTSRKFKKEKNVFDLVNTKDRLFVVGRLVKDSRMADDFDFEISLSGLIEGQQIVEVTRHPSRKRRWSGERFW